VIGANWRNPEITNCISRREHDQLPQAARRVGVSSARIL